ncbi:hypothetical protein DL98DRAFT_531615 [Cadophora sp. DSE1049]|nr:hypothetical protein DL98DRAFT_531615 [Cadophora sp. DSE1049]
MRPTALSVWLLSSQLVSFVCAAITYKACTTAQSDLIDTAITDAIDIAQTHVLMNTASGHWEDRDFHTPTRPVIAIPLGQTPQDMAMNPRPKPGARSSYVVHGFKNPVVGDFTNQVHIVLDPAALGPSSASHDRRTLKTIVMNGLDPAYGGVLEKIRPLEVTILHEFTHALGGLLAPNNGRMLFNDGPQKDTYGWKKCQALRWHPVADPRFKPKWTADSYAQLAMGTLCSTSCLVLPTTRPLQIQGKNTYWDTGVVDPVTLHPPTAIVTGPTP